MPRLPLASDSLRPGSAEKSPGVALDRKRPWASEMATSESMGIDRSATAGRRLAALMIAVIAPAKRPSASFRRALTRMAGFTAYALSVSAATESGRPEIIDRNHGRDRREPSTGTGDAAQITQPDGSKRIRLTNPGRRARKSARRLTHWYPDAAEGEPFQEPLALQNAVTCGPRGPARPADEFGLLIGGVAMKDQGGLQAAQNQNRRQCDRQGQSEPNTNATSPRPSPGAPAHRAPLSRSACAMIAVIAPLAAFPSRL